ncbi:TatD family hydrolase [Fervidibacillus halotolerans]|uniref:TatD family hydrolase n=1 Tax=Fervidibacillus halotolerans TaxID=2980027 RepID=A0A9E8M0B9_9BACI|nr:TatD family hydrolase [Fervidibacillus halotolerans]WAA12861.1 TatD family hydrolase [Fervidibacillus halotolerans]
MRKIIDAHIHFDLYNEQEQIQIIQHMKQDQIEGLITVSEHLESARKNLKLAQKFPNVFPAFGYHPEQKLPTDEELSQLWEFIDNNQEKMIAIGEVGLPYYQRKENQSLKIDGYVELLEQFITFAKKLQKPIILHAVYEDAPVTCSLLEKHSYQKAHFHWFKGDKKTVERMIENGYFISITPDVLYEQEIQQLVKIYPLEQMMVETDGPWPFEGPFEKEMTEPKMIHHAMKKIAEIKRIPVDSIYDTIYYQTKTFYELS